MLKKKVWLVVVIAVSGLSGCSGKDPQLGLHEGRLLPCPNSPNCVVSGARDDRASIEPIAYDGSRDEALTELRRVIDTLAGAKLVSAEDGYLHVECRSRLFGFIDDIEFYLPPEEGRIEMRSAARLGYWDLGVNRRRLETIRAAFQAARGGGGQ